MKLETVLHPKISENSVIAVCSVRHQLITVLYKT